MKLKWLLFGGVFAFLAIKVAGRVNVQRKRSQTVERKLQEWADFTHRQTEAVVRRLQAGEGPTEEWMARLNRRIDEEEGHSAS